MTEVTCDSGILHVSQGRKVISFRPSDLTFESRRELIRAAKSITPDTCDGSKCDGCGGTFFFGSMATKVEDKLLCQKCYNRSRREEA